MNDRHAAVAAFEAGDFDSVALAFFIVNGLFALSPRHKIFADDDLSLAAAREGNAGHLLCKLCEQGGRINGLAHKVQYNEATIQELFLPFLRHMSRKQKEAGCRLIILLAAPPGTGKSTLCLLLEKLSQSVEGLVSLQALGLDGFHHTSAYLRSHKIERDGSMIPMSAIKGAPETFNLEHLKEKLAQVRSENIRWPVYDRGHEWYDFTASDYSRDEI